MDYCWLDMQRPTTYTPPNPLTDNVQDLDREMQHILLCDDLPVGDKARLF